jgi:hypothetical protein
LGDGLLVQKIVEEVMVGRRFMERGEGLEPYYVK